MKPGKPIDYEQPCFLCDSGTLRIFADVTDDMRVKVDHSDPPCPWWHVSKAMADEYLADMKRANGNGGFISRPVKP